MTTSNVLRNDRGQPPSNPECQDLANVDGCFKGSSLKDNTFVESSHSGENRNPVKELHRTNPANSDYFVQSISVSTFASILSIVSLAQ